MPDNVNLTNDMPSTKIASHLASSYKLRSIVRIEFIELEKETLSSRQYGLDNDHNNSMTKLFLTLNSHHRTGYPFQYFYAFETYDTAYAQSDRTT